MSPLCIGSLFDLFRWLFALVFPLGCVLICLVLLMDAFPSLILQGLLSFSQNSLGSGILVTRRRLPQALAWFEGMGTRAWEQRQLTPVCLPGNKAFLIRRCTCCMEFRDDRSFQFVPFFYCMDLMRQNQVFLKLISSTEEVQTPQDVRYKIWKVG